MERKQVPRFNQDIELPLILYILGKGKWWILGLLTVMLSFAFLYLRYTIPHYESTTIIQLTEDNQDLNIFNENKIGDPNVAQDIELLKSQVFIKRIIDSLDLKVSYFKKGRILDFDNYNMAPYSVEILAVEPEGYNIPIYFRFNSLSNYTLRYKINEKKFEYKLNFNMPQKTPHFTINLKAIDIATCKKLNNLYYFILNNPYTLLAKYSNQLKVQVLSDAARTIKINFVDVNPQRASDVANRVAKEFANFNLEKKREGVNNIVAYIDNNLDLVKSNLNEADSSLSSFMSKNNIVESTKERDPILEKNIDEAKQLESQKFEYDIQLLVLNDVIKNVNKQDIDIYEILTQISQIKTDGYVLTLVGNITTAIANRDLLRKGKTENHPDVINANKEIENQRKLLLNSLVSIKSSIETKVKELQLKINKLESGFNIGNGNSNNQMEYLQRKRYFLVNQTYYDLLVQKRVEYDLLSKGYTSGYRVLQYSSPAKSPVYPRKLFILVGVFGVWFMIIFVGLTLKYLSFDKILAVEHITKYTDVAVLGSVTQYKGDMQFSQLVVDKNPKSLIAESFRNIRTNLDFISNQPGSKLIAVTSTISSEGKTFISINLAGILAFTGKKVVIIDADLRKPKIHVQFNVPNEKGLSNLLIGKVSLEECILETRLDNLHFITAGPIPPNPSELLLGKEMTLLIEKLQTIYDYVVIDNAPIGMVTDGMPLLQRADYPIYVFRFGVSRRFFINNLQKLIYDNKLKNISIVLNGLDNQKNNSYGYGNYGYTSTGYGYYEEEKKVNKIKSFFRKK